MFAFKPLGGLYITDDYSLNWFNTVYGNVEVAPFTFGVTILGNMVAGDIELNPFADMATIDVNWVMGDIELDNAWWADISVDVLGDDFEVVDSWYGQADLGFVFGGIEFENSGQWNVDVTYVDDVVIADSNDVDLSVSYAPGWYDIIVSNNTALDLDYAPGANIFVDDDSTHTDINVGDGDVFIFNFGEETRMNLGGGNDYVYNGGEDTQANLGSGNDVFNAGGNGLTLVNGGSDWDILNDNTTGDVVADGFEWLNLVDLNGDTVLMDEPVGGNINIGGVNVGINDAMEVFGEADQYGNATLDFNGMGSLTVLGAAEDYGLLVA